MRGHKRHRPRHGEFLFILIRARAIGLTARVLLSQMGVSKAILENVVFVHQEDSNWPLGEAATLKKKFDEIFSATKYTKALEHIAKLRKEQAASIKEHKLRVENLPAPARTTDRCPWCRACDAEPGAVGSGVWSCSTRAGTGWYRWRFMSCRAGRCPFASPGDSCLRSTAWSAAAPG